MRSRLRVSFTTELLLAGDTKDWSRAMRFNAALRPPSGNDDPSHQTMRLAWSGTEDGSGSK